MEPLLLGIDAGGSKTVACLACEGQADLQVLGRGVAGPANPNAIGFEKSLANLTSAVQEAFRAAGIPRRPIASAVLAAAGSDNDEHRQIFSNWARETLHAEWFEILHDAWPVLAAGTPERCGIALISGTGSLAFGRAPSGQTARVGGWGFLFGDEGSGYDLAVAGLRAVAHASDGRAPATRLVDATLEHFHVERPEALAKAVYPLANDRQRIASFAEVVLEVAAQGDAAACGLVAQAAARLEVMVTALAARLDWAGAAIPLALSGSILVRTPLVRDQLQQILRSASFPLGPVAVVTEPVMGALQLAREFRHSQLLYNKAKIDIA